jgi:tetratricopeptide (TPR) repeat protein
MNFLEQVRNWLAIDPTPPPTTRVDAVREALERGQRAKRAEEYPQALDALEQAMRLVKENRDFTSMSVVALQKAEVLICQQRWEEAGEVLATIRQRAQVNNQKAQTAYVLDMLGVLAQAQGNWDSARQYYEQALNVARAVGAIGAEGRALGHLADTYLHENNASYAVHLLREALPRLNGASEIELGTYFVGLLGQGLIQTGQEGEGNQLLGRALKLAKQMDDRRYERRWSLALGERAMVEGRYDDAYTHYERALQLFSTPAFTYEYIVALCQMSKASLKVSLHDDALRYAEYAEALSSTLDDGGLNTMVQSALGMALHAGGRSAKAIAYLQVAAEGYESLERGADEVETLRHLAASLADIADDESAISTYRRAAQRAEAHGIRLALAEVRRDLGLLYSQRRMTQLALQEWSAALVVYEAEKAHAQIARLRCDIGNARRQLGQGQRAMKDYEQALMALNLLNDDPETRGVVLSNAANAYVDQGDVESAEAFFKEAISLAQRAGNQAAESTRRGNYGWYLLAVGRPRQAINALEQALQMSQMLKLDLQVAVQTDNLGLAYDLLGDHTTALEYHQRALERVRPLRNSEWESVFKTNLANALLGLGKVEDAATLFEQALAQSRSSENVDGIVQALIGMARVYLGRKEPQKAEAALNEAISMARKTDLRRLLAQALSVHSEQQAAVKNTERSVALWGEARKLFNILQDPKAKVSPAWLPDTPVQAS